MAMLLFSCYEYLPLSRVLLISRFIFFDHTLSDALALRNAKLTCEFSLRYSGSMSRTNNNIAFLDREMGSGGEGWELSCSRRYETIRGTDINDGPICGL